MSREIKFRVWDTKLSLMLDWESIKDTQVFWDALEGVDAEIMQFTGLLDKNGKEVYEGDFVRGAWVSEIVFEDGRFKMKDNEELLEICVEYLEVIGNIYENGDLLK